MEGSEELFRRERLANKGTSTPPRHLPLKVRRAQAAHGDDGQLRIQRIEHGDDLIAIAERHHDVGQPRPFSQGLGGKERVKDPVQNFGGMPVPLSVTLQVM
jgi:hypothetical protein